MKIRVIITLIGEKNYLVFNVELQIFPFSNAFYRGLTDLISPSWLKLFNAGEFNQVRPSIHGYVYCSSEYDCMTAGCILYGWIHIRYDSLVN